MCPHARGLARRLTHAATIGLCIAVSPACNAAWILDLEAGLTHESNLPRAQLPADRISGNLLSATLAAGWFQAIGDRLGLTLTADARVARYHGRAGLDLDAFGGTLGARYKLGLGPHVPWVGVSLSAAREEYGTSVRDSDRYTLSLSAGKRFSSRLAFSAAIRAERREAHESIQATPLFPGDTFALSSRSASVQATYALTPRVDAFASFSVRSGDVVASTRRNVQIFRATTAISPDPAFGPDYFAYRLDGVTRTPALGLAWSITEYTALSLVYSREITHANRGLNYYNTVLNASLLHRF